MAVILKDHLSDVLNETPYKSRHDIWLWFYLTNIGAQLPVSGMNGSGMRERMASFLSINPQLIDQVKRTRNAQLVSEKNLEWINDGKRQAEWLITKTTSYLGNNGLIPPLGLHGKELLISTIDLWNADLTEKKLFLNELEKNWSEHKKGDKPFHWFKDDQQKCVIAWEWLSKNLSSELLFTQAFDNYDDLMIFFDRSRLIQDQKTLYIDKIKRKWNQQKYRQGLTGKSQYNFILSDKAIKRLDKLANTHELSRAKILEILLQMESEKNLYIPEKIRLSKSTD